MTFIAFLFGMVLALIVGFAIGFVVAAHVANKDEIVKKILSEMQPIGVVTDAGGGSISVFADRDLARYPEEGQRVFVGSRAWQK